MCRLFVWTYLLIYPGVGVGGQVPRPTCALPSESGNLSRVQGESTHPQIPVRTHPQIPDSL